MQYICTNLTLNVPIVKHTVEPSRYVVHCDDLADRVLG